MTQYIKIDTLWKRDPTNGRIIDGDYSNPVFENIIRWTATEKIDGTNIRIMYDPATDTVKFAGKTDNAQMHPELLNYLSETFTPDKFSTFTAPVVIYGEGCHAKIQNSSKYLNGSTAKVILFDIKIGKWWLEHEAISTIAEMFGVEMAPILGTFTKEQIKTLVRTGVKSMVADNGEMFEGIVATACPMVLDRTGAPVKFKLKVKDYKKLRCVK